MNALRALFQAVKELWASIKAVFRDAKQAQEEIKQQKELRQAWHLCWDSRRRSQVLMNRPAFAVRKII